MEKTVLKHFPKFTGKHLCQGLFLNKVAGLKFLRTTFLQNTSGQLLLKCDLIDSCDNEMSTCVNNYNITNSKFEKQLSIEIDQKPNFNTYVDEICKKPGQRLNELSREAPYMELSKRLMRVNRFFLSQFSCYPLAWMCHSRIKNNDINCLH